MQVSRTLEGDAPGGLGSCVSQVGRGGADTLTRCLFAEEQEKGDKVSDRQDTKLRRARCVDPGTERNVS